MVDFPCSNRVVYHLTRGRVVYHGEKIEEENKQEDNHSEEEIQDNNKDLQSNKVLFILLIIIQSIN